MPTLLPVSRKMSRRQFEGLIKGEWEHKRHPSGRAYRQNEDFITRVRRLRRPNGSVKRVKEISDGTSVLRAKTWRELARALKLV